MREVTSLLELRKPISEIMKNYLALRSNVRLGVYWRKWAN